MQTGEHKLNIDIDKLTPEQRAELTERLAESGRKLSKPEVSDKVFEFKPASSEGFTNAEEGSSEVKDNSAEDNTKAGAQAGGKITPIDSKGKVEILNRFLAGKESFEDLDVTMQNAAEVTEEALNQKKAA